MYEKQLFVYEISFPFTELHVANFLPRSLCILCITGDEQFGRNVS
jgi:hypothetical protein